MHLNGFVDKIFSTASARKRFDKITKEVINISSIKKSKAKTIKVSKSVRKSGMDDTFSIKAEELQQNFKLGYNENAKMEFEE